MSLPFYVSCDRNSPLLYELPDDRFQVMTEGSIGPLIAGYQFLLVDSALAEFLKGLDIERVTYRPATIFDPRSGQEIRTHTRVVVQQFFCESDLPDMPMSGLRILSFGGHYYFVTAALKAELEKGGFGYLQFSEGLSQFAGCAA